MALRGLVFNDALYFSFSNSAGAQRKPLDPSFRWDDGGSFTVAAMTIGT
jgi:hypothetical protein